MHVIEVNNRETVFYFYSYFKSKKRRKQSNELHEESNLLIHSER